MTKTVLQKGVLYGAVAAMCLSISPTTAVQAATGETAVQTGPSDVQEVQAFTDQLLSDQKLKAMGIPGAEIVIVKDNQVLLQKGYGFADVAKKLPIDPENTRFRLASISKVFTATGVMQLAEQGKIDLNGDINKYLGDLGIKNSFDTPVTVAHLLTHSTGFEVRDPRPTDIRYDNLDADYPLEAYAKETAPSVVRKPGEAFMYDNYASMLQGLIVQKVAGVPFHSYVDQNIFSVLGMKNSTFNLTSDVRSKLAVGYQGGQALPDYAIEPTDLPQGGMVSTGSDMAKFMIANLNNGSYAGKQILKVDTLKDMQAYHHYANPQVPDMAYGFEAPMFPDNGEHVIAKGGNIPGFASYMWLLPEKKIGVFAIANASSSTFQETVFTEFMNHYYPKKAQNQYLTTPKGELARFEGIYDDLRLPNRHTKITVTGDGELSVLDATFHKKGKLRQIDKLLFEDEKGNKMSFVEENGKIKYMRYMNLSYSSALPSAKGYSDVPADHAYAPYIRDLQTLGVMTGNPDGTFAPKSSVTRAEFISTLIRASHLPSNPAVPTPFTDIRNHWAATDIQTAVAYGLIAGKTPTTFAPETTITRQEAANIVYRILKLSGVTPLDAKLTGTTDPWAIEGVKTIVALGLFGPEVTATTPNAPIDYKSTQNMTRAEVAALMAKVVLPQ